MSKIPYLFRRGNVFYFRLAVPVELQDRFQCREVVKSLRTENRSDAIPLDLGFASQVTKLFNDEKTMNDMVKKRQHYQFVQLIRRRLQVCDDHFDSSWMTLRETMKTQCRVTVSF